MREDEKIVMREDEKIVLVLVLTLVVWFLLA